MQIRADRIIVDDLWQRARTTRPFRAVIDLLAGVEFVVRIIEGAAVGEHRHRAEHGVVEHALHAVAVTRIPGDAQQIAGQLEMRVRAAHRLEARLEVARSEEHTSELQSLMRISYAVFCLNKKINTK